MIIRSFNTVRERPSDGVAGTNYVNELTQVLRGMQEVPLQKERANGLHQLIPLRVKITSNADGAGKYNGKVYDLPEIVLEGTSDLTEQDIGILNMDCLIYNAAEVDGTGHEITDFDKPFHGLLIGWTDVDENGKAIVVIPSGGTGTDDGSPQYQYMHRVAVADNVPGWDWPRFGPILD